MKVGDLVLGWDPSIIRGGPLNKPGVVLEIYRAVGDPASEKTAVIMRHNGRKTCIRCRWLEVINESG